MRLYVRPVRPVDYPLLETFLYEAVFVPPGMAPPPKEILFKPDVSIYIDGFGRQRDDIGFAAELDGNVIGMAWVRIINAFGHIDDNTPELAISVLPQHRGKNVGTALLHALLAELTKRGYAQTSLSVQKQNSAFRLYQRMGYMVAQENAEDYLMLKKLVD